MPQLPRFSLTGRLTDDLGSWYLPGIQALVRLPLEQARRDAEAGLRIGTFVTGYPGSPLAGYDLQLKRHAGLLAEHGVMHVPAGNEEQAAGALMGTQMLDSYPHPEYDGVAGFWYGKGPGADRAGDALKHGNFAGTSRLGSVVLLSGEDHDAKSSTMPFQQEYAFMSAGIPVLFPGSVADIRRLGLHAVAMSRFSGCWVALKLVSQLCDGGETVNVGGDPVPVAIPDVEIGGEPFVKRADFSFFPGKNLEHERELYDARHLAVLAYARANRLHREQDGPGDVCVGIITSGKAGADVRQALDDLGLARQGRLVVPLRLLELDLIYPLDDELVRSFADGLEHVIVVEEKRGVLESAVRAALQPLGRSIAVEGKRDLMGRPLFQLHGALDADIVAEGLARAVPEELISTSGRRRLSEIASVRGRSYATTAQRTPNFCSGCPHSTSTVLGEGQLAWGAPGCGCFNTVIEQPHRHIDTMTQYGGEGTPWIGLAPFTSRKHIVQHVGDGSIYHSSYLNIRWAVAARANMTFKILYNGAVANTGAQEAVGSRGVTNLVRALAAEGVERIAIVSKEPEQYGRDQLPDGVEVSHVNDLVAASKALEDQAGVTVLLYDESCANERRRQQKRGLIEAPSTHVFINETVCENCGDCGAKSNCMSLQKVPTEFGPKTQVHASSCNFDQSCLQGDCPAFVTVDVAPNTGRRRPDPLAQISVPNPPDPGATAIAGPVAIYMPGVGGTGVITANALLAVAAQLDGFDSITYDQTGAAQKWGPVLSNITIAPKGQLPAGNKVGVARADVYLALDEIGAASPVNLDRCDPATTALVLNTDLFPTGEMVRDISHRIDREAISSTLDTWTNSRISIPARTLAEKLFGDYMLTNVIALGAAVQAGLIPLSTHSLEAAIELNGVDVSRNKRALMVGRQWLVDPSTLQRVVDPRPSSAAEEITRRRAAMPRRHRRAYDALMLMAEKLPEGPRRDVTIRVAELIDYQSVAYAESYLRTVLRVAEAESCGLGAAGELTAVVARNLFKLMAYKDEYEVARLYLSQAFRERLLAEFEAPGRVTYHFHPPLVRRVGRSHKLPLGPWFDPVLHVLRASRHLRGTPLDPFGRQRSRADERGLVAWYIELVELAISTLGEHPVERELRVVRELLELADSIRGYEEIKSRSAEKARVRARALRKRLEPVM